MKEGVEKLISVSTYPLVISLGIIAHLFMNQLGSSLNMSTYLPILFGAAILTAMELKFSYRPEWKGTKKDVVEDGLYMALVQLILPPLVNIWAALTILELLNQKNWNLTQFWPQNWNVGLQVVMMLLTADFLRYWLHRASHEWPFLWRFHAVHHSPHKLYWFNVGRFHPIEKFVQMLFDTIPFVILGVRKEVIALYLVFYSINGFFQHCNVQLSLGPLNYLISGPELHRWHHSRLVKESNQNYGNNLIIWDLVFGTWFLPSSRQVGELGLINRNYPMSFVKQLASPFKKGLDKE